MVFAIEAALDRVLRHPLRLLEVDVPRDLLKLAKVLHVFYQLIVRAIEAGVDIDLVLVHKERRLQRRRGVPLLPLNMVDLEVIDGEELAVGLLLQLDQILLHVLVTLRKVRIIVLPFVHQVGQLPLQHFILLRQVLEDVVLLIYRVPVVLRLQVALMLHELVPEV